jgi:intracellular multiplication protein IcmB
MLQKIGQAITDFVSDVTPLHNYEYCQLATSARNGDDSTFSCEDGGYFTAIEIDGLNKVIGSEEIKSCGEMYQRLISTIVAKTGGAHELDFEYYVNTADTEGYLNRFSQSQMATAERIGFDLQDQVDESNKVMANHMNYEHGVLYVKTNISALVDVSAYLKRVKAAGKELVANNIRFREAQKAWLYSEDLYNMHKAVLSTIMHMFKDEKFSVRIMSIAEASGRMATSARKKYVAPFQPKMWGSQAGLKMSLDDDPTQPNLFNLGFTHLGMQILQDDILETDSYGIVKINDQYVAPVLIETVPEGDVDSMMSLLTELPLYMPFTYRCHVVGQRNNVQSMASALAPFLAFSKKYLGHNDRIRNSFDYIQSLTENGVATVNVSIVCSTWAPTEKLAKQLREELITKINAWGHATCMVERGNGEEAALSTIAGFTNMNRAPYTLMAPWDAARMGLMVRPASPFEDGDTMLYHPSGKPFPASPISKELEAYIEIDMAPSGSGKSVKQCTFNRDMNFRPGRRDLARHVTIDIGSSGKGTVKSLQDSLPDHMKHKLVFEKITLDPRKSMNPMDLQLGLKEPTPFDFDNICKLVGILATPENHKIQPFMAELIQLTVRSAYSRCADRDDAKKYQRGENRALDNVLDSYPETADPATWGANKSWYKVRDFLFKKGELRWAKIATRYAVPLISELPGFAQQDVTIVSKFGPKGKDILEDFSTLISAAVNKYKILSQPTQVDYDTARYIVLDLNDVTQAQGSNQTAFMYGLVAHVALRDYWLNDELYDLFEPMYREYAVNHISEIREEKLGVTFEEFRRTQGQADIRNMISRFMAEGRKWDVMVRLVAQLPQHLDKEMMEHATVINLMGAWQEASIKELKTLVKLSRAEEAEMLGGGTHGPRRGGPAFIIKYRLKSLGWGSQIVRLAKSPYELWATSTTNEDMILRDFMEEQVGNTEVARRILTYAYKDGTAKDAILAAKKKLSGAAAQDADVYNSLAMKAIRAWKNVQAA